MKKLFTSLKRAVAILRLVAMLSFILFCSVITSAQLSLPIKWGAFESNLKVYGLGATIGEPSSANVAERLEAFLGMPDVSFLKTLISTNEATYHTAEAFHKDTIVLDIPDVGTLHASNSEMYYVYGPADGTLTGVTVQRESALTPDGSVRFKMPVTFALGTKKGLMAFRVTDNFLTRFLVVIPMAVEGPKLLKVDSLGTITQPQIPYLVLHAPPGDLSICESQQTKTICREFTDTYAQDGSNSANVAIKIGIAGEAGFILTTAFEFSMTFSAGFTAGDMKVITTSDQTCMTVSQGFSTAPMSGPNGGGDVFIGFGQEMAYGFGEFYRIDSTTQSVVTDTNLVYMPVGPTTKFAYTKDAILSDIKFLQSIVSDSMAVGRRAANDAQNQIDVWHQVLSLNDANVSDPNNVKLEPVNFSAGVLSYQESAITVLETNSIEVEHYIEATAGVMSVIEVAGSGISGGFEYKSSKRFGKTQNQTQESAKLVKYTLNDDDSGDIFKLQVVRDPMYGTPIFRIQDLAGTKSSCPYQGGYQREQPALEISVGSSGNFGSHATVSDGSDVALFRINMINKSNEARTYFLKQDPLTNLDGAKITVGASTILGTNNSIDYPGIPAHGAIGPLLVSVRRGDDPKVSLYDSIKLVLYSECEPEIEATVTLSVQFVDISSTKDHSEDIIGTRIFPNPTSDAITVELNLLQSTTVNIDLYDMLGQLQMKGIEENFPDGVQQKQLDLTQMSPGIYMLVIQSESSRLTRKVMINR